MIREGSPDMVSLSLHIKEVRGLAQQIFRGKAFQEEVTASAKVLKQVCVFLLLQEQGGQGGRGKRHENRLERSWRWGQMA